MNIYVVMCICEIAVHSHIYVCECTFKNKESHVRVILAWSKRRVYDSSRHKWMSGIHIWHDESHTHAHGSYCALRTPSLIPDMHRMHVWHISHSCMTNITLLCEIFFLHSCVTCLWHSCVKYVTFMYDKYSIAVWDISHSCVTCISHSCVTYITFMCDMYYIAVWHSCVTYITFMCDIYHIHVWHVYHILVWHTSHCCVTHNSTHVYMLCHITRLMSIC